MGKNDTKKIDKPYGMALKKNWKGFLEYFDDKTCQDLLNHLTDDGDTALHIAAASGNHQLLKRLLEKLSKEPRESVVKALMQSDIHGNTALHEVATTDCVEAAKEMVDIFLKCSDNEDEKKLLIRNKLGETPFYRAAALGRTKMLKYFDDRIGFSCHHFHRGDNVSILHIAVIGQHFDTAIWLLEKNIKLANEESAKKHGMKALRLLALMPSAFESSSPMKTERCWNINKIWKEKQKHKNAVKLVKLLVDKEISWEKEIDIEIQEEDQGSMDIERDSTIFIGLGKGSMYIEKKLVDLSPAELVELLVDKDKPEGKYQKKSSQDQPENKVSLNEIPLFFAESNGITEIFKEIIEKNPEAIHYVSDDKEENVLHVAIKYRQEKIFKCIKKYEMSMPKLASRIDNDGNTILHHVANTELFRGTCPGPALQLAEELKWFERVKDEMPAHYLMHRNTTRRITATDLFEETHADQLQKAQKWIKETAQSCSTLSILVATIVFAVAFTVPGGNNDEGLPIFLHSPLFYVFSIMDIASLAFSLSSVVMFPSILTSSCEYHDFLHALPTKMIAGFTFLFISVITSMVAFSASLLLIIRLDKKWTASLYAAAFFPVIVLVLMQLPFYVSLVGNLKDYYEKVKDFFLRKKDKEG